jgi:hypothetical protein
MASTAGAARSALQPAITVFIAGVFAPTVLSSLKSILSLGFKRQQ